MPRVPPAPGAGGWVRPAAEDDLPGLYLLDLQDESLRKQQQPEDAWPIPIPLLTAIRGHQKNDALSRREARRLSKVKIASLLVGGHPGTGSSEPLAAGSAPTTEIAAGAVVTEPAADADADADAGTGSGARAGPSGRTRVEQAQEAVRIALLLSCPGGYVQALVELARGWLELDNLEPARRCAELAVRVCEPDSYDVNHVAKLAKLPENPSALVLAALCSNQHGLDQRYVVLGATCPALLVLGAVHGAAGRPAAAVAEYERALARLRALPALEHPSVGDATVASMCVNLLANISNQQAKQAQFDAAAATLDSADAEVARAGAMAALCDGRINNARIALVTAMQAAFAAADDDAGAGAGEADAGAGGVVPGATVELHGLKTAAMNGKRAVVSDKLLPKKPGFVAVMIEGEAKPRAVRLENLRPV